MPENNPRPVDVLTLPETELIHNETIALQARLLVGGEGLNPSKSDIANVMQTDIGNKDDILRNIEQRNYDAYNTASHNERLEQTAVSTEQLPQAITVWVDQTTNLLKQNFTQTCNFTTEKQTQWKETISNVIRKQVDQITTQDIQQLYQRYFKDGKSCDVQAFVKQIASSYTYTENGSIRLHKEALQRDKECILWVSSIFGEHSAQMIGHLLDAEVNVHENPEQVVKAANAETNGSKRVNSLDTAKEKPTLEFIWRYGQPINVSKKNNFSVTPRLVDPPRSPDPTQPPERVTNPEKEALHEKFKQSAEFLRHLDQLAEGIQVDPDTGNIEYVPPTSPTLSHPYQQKYDTLLQQFHQRNEDKTRQIKAEAGVLDVKHVLGAIVVTFDSSREIPPFLQHDYTSDPKNHRGQHHSPDKEYLGIVSIDLNKAKRRNTTPTTSAIHELHHHSLTISDYLITQDAAIQLESAYRGGGRTALYGDGVARTPHDVRMLNDAEKYKLLLGRDVRAIEVRQVREQLDYLNELHSSFLQRKQSWFLADEGVYAFSGDDKKHWELVGNNPQDIEAAKKMLAYMQGLYMFSRIQEHYKSLNQPLDDATQQFITNLDKAWLAAGSRIGVSRTIHQALEFTAEIWEKFAKLYDSMLTDPRFDQDITNWEQSGHAVEKLRDVLFAHKQAHT